MTALAIDVAHLIRTGEVKKFPKATYSDYICASAHYFQENEERMGQSYFNALTVLRPDIAEQIRGTECDAFYDNDLLPAMLAKVYKLWK